MAEKEMTRKIAFLLALALLLRLAFLGTSAFFKDEALYAEITDEMVLGSGMIPHYAGVPVAWKPPLTFWAYAAFSQAIGPLGLPVEILYRLPGVLLGALCPVLTYLIVREVTRDEDLAFISGIAYSGNGLAVVTSRAFLTDTLLSVLILGSLLCYIVSARDRKLALLGGLLTALAIFTKTLVGLFGLALAIAYLALYERKELAKKEFLASLLAVPLAFGLLYLFVPGMAEQYGVDSTGRVAIGVEQVLGYLGANASFLLTLTIPWLVIAIYGAYRYRSELRKAGFFYVWLALGMLPVFALGPLPWYFLPLVPAISVFASKVVLAGGKADLLAMGMALFLVIISLVGISMYMSVATSVLGLEESREIGSSLSGKGAILLMGYNPTMVYYKFHGDADYGSLDAFFPLNETILGNGEARELIMDSKLPAGSIELQRAITITPYLLERTHLGNFSEPRKTVVLGKKFYWAYVENRTGYEEFRKTREDGYYVVLERK